ncbi:MAG: HD domain-containing protein [Anaerolineales bacterium]
MTYINRGGSMLTIEKARSWYSEYDPVHGFDHVLRVLRLATWLGEKLGADQEILKAAALLHDASGAHPEGEEGREVPRVRICKFRQRDPPYGWLGTGRYTSG